MPQDYHGITMATRRRAQLWCGRFSDTRGQHSRRRHDWRPEQFNADAKGPGLASRRACAGAGCSGSATDAEARCRCQRVLTYRQPKSWPTRAPRPHLSRTSDAGRDTGTLIDRVAGRGSESSLSLLDGCSLTYNLKYVGTNRTETSKIRHSIQHSSHN